MDPILLLDPPPRSLQSLEAALAGVAPDMAREVYPSADELVARLESDPEVAAVFIEHEAGPDAPDGAQAIRRVRTASESVPIVAVAPRGNVQIVSRAVEAGATNFMVLGDQLAARVAALLGKLRNVAALRERNQALARENLAMRERIVGAERVIGHSPQIVALLERARRVACIPRPVLIVGERGTGKELVARFIHDCAAAGKKPEQHPLVTVNCAAFAETMLEAELFGHEKGAYTGADRAMPGRFEQAAGGTLFLDEIGAMSLAFQQKILRAVEYRVVTRVGGLRELPVRTRVIAATNADLERLMREGRFLRDLYDRLSFETIHVPPLRERTGDVELLAQHFLERFMAEIPAFQGKRLSRSAIQVLNRCTFPGNVRELKNIIERAAYRDTTDEITPEDLGLDPEMELRGKGAGFEQRIESFKQRLINDALIEAGGNQAQAARSLGLTYHQFRYYYRALMKSRHSEEDRAK